MNDEINNLLNVQKEQLGKIEEQKILLLGSSSEESKYENIKQAFGWDDTDRILRVETNKVMELSLRMKQNIDSNILTEETLLDYCIKNNYVLCNVRNYKGKIPEELLRAIDEYCKNNDRNLASEANIQNLFILCQFTDLTAKNDDIKRNKRYGSQMLPKIILLERLDKSNKYVETHYKTITELGEKKEISNFVKSIFLTHTKSLNHLRYLVAYSTITLLLLLISFICDPKTYFYGLVNTFVYISLSILILKSIITWKSGVHSNFDSDLVPEKSEFPTFLNYYNSSNEYDNRSVARKSKERFLTSYMSYSKFNKKSMILRNQIAFWLMNLSFLLVFLGLIHIGKMTILHSSKRKQVIIDIKRFKSEDQINDSLISRVYMPKGLFNYDVKTVRQKVKDN